MTYEQEIRNFFTAHPALNVEKLNAECGFPKSTMQQFLSGSRALPEKHWFRFAQVAARYGFAPFGYMLESPADEPVILTRYFTGEQKMKEISHPEGGTSFEYWEKTHKELHDVFDFVEWAVNESSQKSYNL